jgi:serine/threonine-protein kinase RsbW
MDTSVTLAATLENLGRVLQMVRAAAAECGFSSERISEVEVAAEEAFVNVVRHAYGGQGDCTVTCVAEGGTLTLSLTDAGLPFDPVSAPAPDIESDVADRPIGGLGILLVKQFMDEISYKRHQGRNVTVMKALARNTS